MFLFVSEIFFLCILSYLVHIKELVITQLCVCSLSLFLLLCLLIIVIPFLNNFFFQISPNM